ncbi:peptidoglycan D,D-transpeptidase FtsI family protein [Microbacterium indicum]|uniref:peptidoglycan D,D-transpeptidase FtsI family protein n=1 Tax=Microbacterium indicum TaxID=358100 RepID=UPI00041366EA|nr:penicillin-binding protein 2 [Microbacterium indicum]
MIARTRRSARRRTGIAVVVVMIVLVSFVVRLFDIQVVSAKEHVQESMDLAFSSSSTIAGVRGSIVDANGTVLASSSVDYDVALDPGLAKDVDRYDDAGEKYVETWGHLAERIGSVVGMSGADVEKVATDALASNPDARWAKLIDGISTAQYRELLDLDAPMLSITSNTSRVYPNGAVGGNLVGFTGSDGEGLAGYELMENSCLDPTDGEISYQTSGDGGVRIPGTTQETPAVDGGTLQLTIDTDLSWYLLQMLKEEVETQQANSGQIMVVEVGTGAVKAAVEYPTVDPNDPTATDEANRGSRIFTNTFEPGSTFKAITSATVLDQGAATPLTEVTASGHETLDNGAVVGDSFSHPSYDYTLAGAMIDSSNVALSKISALVSDQTRYDYLKKFGVGEQSSVGFLGEESGVLREPSEWDNQTKYATAFGQGFTVTMPQVVNAYQTIANGGKSEPLHIVEGCTDADGDTTSPDLPESQQVISEKAAGETMQLLEGVADFGSVSDQIQIPGYRIAAKTGTAQKTDGNGNYKAGLYYTSLIGIAPADDPQYIVMVTLDEPKRVTSSSANAPAFVKAMTQVLKTYRVQPSTSEFEPLPKFAE